MMEVLRANAVVVGGGVAGLAAALGLSGQVVLLTKAAFGEGGSTAWAQGGVAAALSPDDSPQAHATDTIGVGGGISDEQAVTVLTTEGPDRVRELILAGARFDRAPDGALLFGREAGHSRNRIIHADGDATGTEILRALSTAVAGRRNVAVHDHTFAVDLIVADRRVVGVLAIGADGREFALLAPAIVLATGGLGRIYAHTTNPVEVTGDGLAMAARAGARLVDIEFVQFHPTALDADQDPMPLLTEALRGAGAFLIDEYGHRFMPTIHPAAELAPRDVVARAIWERIQSGGRVYLDATHSVGADFPHRFPSVFRYCRGAGFDPRTGPIPVSPAAHYHMGGIETDLSGRSTLPGLWAVGEAAATGVHGANRLASNSLLEGLVFGARAAASIARESMPPPTDIGAQIVPPLHHDPGLVAELRSIMWQHVGIARCEEGLEVALDRIRSLELELQGRAGEAANMVLAGRLVTLAALERRESRGAHHRIDFPDPGSSGRRYYTLEYATAS